MTAIEPTPAVNTIAEPLQQGPMGPTDVLQDPLLEGDSGAVQMRSPHASRERHESDPPADPPQMRNVDAQSGNIS